MRPAPRSILFLSKPCAFPQMCPALHPCLPLEASPSPLSPRCVQLLTSGASSFFPFTSPVGLPLAALAPQRAAEPAGGAACHALAPRCSLSPVSAPAFDPFALVSLDPPSGGAAVTVLRPTASCGLLVRPWRSSTGCSCFARDFQVLYHCLFRILLCPYCQVPTPT